MLLYFDISEILTLTNVETYTLRDKLLNDLFLYAYGLHYNKKAHCNKQRDIRKVILYFYNENQHIL